MSHSQAKDEVALKTIGNYTEDGNLGFSLGLGFHSKPRLLVLLGLRLIFSWTKSGIGIRLILPQVIPSYYVVQ
jgi:hypothetical protein